MNKNKIKLPSRYVKVSNVNYGSKLKGIKIYYEGLKPKNLKKDGSISFGKNILELLIKTFENFQWIITNDKDEIREVYNKYRIWTSIKTINKMKSQSFALTRDIKEDLIKNTFSSIYPDKFKYSLSTNYKSGNLATILQDNILDKLSSEDKDALNRFLPEYISKESVSSVNILKATAQITTLKDIANEMKMELKGARSEDWWQKYIHTNILIIQQGYIQVIDKLNVAIGTSKFPDFSLISHDSFLDILEIKKPSTKLIRLDGSRDNYFWDNEISRAIIQVENYIENVSKHGPDIRSFIKDKWNIELKVVRPRGIILAGDASVFTNQKQKDDFRLLSASIKNILFLTYDELIIRLENYIEVLERYSPQT